MDWTRTHLPGEPADAVAVATRGRLAFAALADGRVLHSDDGGRRWGLLDEAPAPGPTALLSTPVSLLLATWGGLFYAGAGGAWQPVAGLPADALVIALSSAEGPPSARVVAGTLRGGAYRSLDGGATWTPANDGLPLDGAGLEVHALVAASHGLYAAHRFGVNRSDDGGARWGPSGIGLPLMPGRADLATDGRAAFASVEGRLFETTGAGAWAEVRPDGGAPFRLMPGALGALYGLDGVGALLASADGGLAWTPAGGGLPSPPEALAVAGRTPHRALLAALGADGLWRRPAGAAPRADAAPRIEVVLEDAVPNPVADEADLAFSLSAPAEVVLSVHDHLDREVARVAEGVFAAGRHHVRFVPVALPAGLYRCRLRAAGRACARPLVLLE